MISKEDIEHLEDLARVKFHEGTAGKLAKDLGDVLGCVETLKEVDVSDVQEMTHAVEGMKNVMRLDGEPEKSLRLATEQIDAFPEKYDSGHGTYLEVKPIL